MIITRPGVWARVDLRVSPFPILLGQRCHTTKKHKIRHKVDQKRPDKTTGFDHALRGPPAQIRGQEHTEGTAGPAEVM
jgi:hypothetical protein